MLPSSARIGLLAAALPCLPAGVIAAGPPAPLDVAAHHADMGRVDRRA